MVRSVVATAAMLVLPLPPQIGGRGTSEESRSHAIQVDERVPGIAFFSGNR